MSLPRYPKYKPSDVEWLGDVPEGWSAGRLRHFARRYSGGTPDKTNLGYWQDGVIPWLNSGAVNDRLISEPSTFITAEAFANSSAKWVPTGALVMALAGQGKTKGMVAQLGIPSTCNQSMAAIVPNPKLNARFLFWWLDSNYQSIRNLAGGDLRDGLNLELVGDIPLPVVPLPEQTAIAEFLDRETGRIDGLVAEQRRLMEMLKEKRQAVISHAVTKGLNPHAPMKPSGIEWLGDVPAGWEVCALRHSISAIFNGMSANQIDQSDTTVPVTRIETISNGSIDESRMGYIEARDARRDRKLQVGDILFSNINSLNMIGNCAYYFGGREIYAGMNLLVIRAHKQRHARWLYWLIRSPLFRRVVESLAKPSVNQASIPQPSIIGIVICVPPLPEQAAIAEFLDTELAKFDTLTAETQRAIDLLQERRTALISAAVTGQIDVRQHLKN
jgi:type I restriction enzyme S subunit